MSDRIESAKESPVLVLEAGRTARHYWPPCMARREGSLQASRARRGVGVNPADRHNDPVYVRIRKARANANRIATRVRLSSTRNGRPVTMAALRDRIFRRQW